VKVELSDEALAQVNEIDEWWRLNRPKAPDLFTRELEQTLAALESTPTLGVAYGAGSKTVRRLLLHRTHYHLYFAEQGDALVVIAVWNAFRGSGPRL
jgi:plasmid stabilization system protein ParE